MKAKTIIIALLLYCSAMQAQPRRINVDSMVDAMNITKASFPEDLADTLLVPFKTDSEKVRAIFYWMTQHIRYDMKEFHFGPGISPGKDPDTYEYRLATRTLRLHRGICGDYSLLFAYLCNYAHISCTMVTGFALVERPFFLHMLLYNQLENHAWNAVCINGNYHLVDVTWACGEGKEGNRPVNETYYLTPPDVFILDHHPVDTKWELLNKPLRMWAFMDNAKHPGKQAAQTLAVNK
jgi:transglutaminase/protease-like cytokinesis protein 3